MEIGIVSFILLLGFCACQKESKDITPPVFNSLALSTDTVEPFDVLNVEFSISDNAALNQIRSRISTSFAKSFGNWETLVVRDISGTQYQGTISFVVPDTARAGYYQIATQGADMDGNGTVDSVLYFTVLQPNFAPELSDFATKPPILDNTLFLTVTDSLSFAGMAVDDINIDKVSIDLRTAEEKSIKSLLYSISDTVMTWDFAANADTIAPDYGDLIPTELLIKLTDSDGNLTRKSFPVDFTP